MDEQEKIGTAADVIRPRSSVAFNPPRDDHDQAVLKEIERQRALCDGGEAMQKELELKRAMFLQHAGGVLDTAQVDTAMLANALARMSHEVEGVARAVSRLDELVRVLLETKAPFTEDDIIAIKAHVRHPGALEAARLRETIRCAVLAVKAGADDAALAILGEGK